MAQLSTERQTDTQAVEQTRKDRPQRRFRWFNLFLYAMLVVLTITSLGPFIFSFFSSFKTFTHILDFPPALIPNPWTWDNYVTLLRYPGFPRWMLNSFIYAVGAAILNVLF